MRRLFLTAIVALTGGSAMASSIEYINGAHVANGSFVRLDCAGCQPVKDKTTPQGYAIPSIEPGTQHTEMREVDGKRALLRTEAWLGGAPVTFVSTNPAWM
ncbi:plant virulence effector HPE1-like domain-containing protein, partial [Rhizobium sp. BR5]